MTGYEDLPQATCCARWTGDCDCGVAKVQGNIRFLPEWIPVTADDVLLVIAALVWIPYLISWLRP